MIEDTQDGVLEALRARRARLRLHGAQPRHPRRRVRRHALWEEEFVVALPTRPSTCASAGAITDEALRRRTSSTTATAPSTSRRRPTSHASRPLGLDVVHVDGAPPGGRVDGNKHYPEDLGVEVHADGEIWSRARRDIHRSPGRQTGRHDHHRARSAIHAGQLPDRPRPRRRRSPPRRLYGTSAQRAVQAAFAARAAARVAPRTRRCSGKDGRLAGAKTSGTMAVSATDLPASGPTAPPPTAG